MKDDLSHVHDKSWEQDSVNMCHLQGQSRPQLIKVRINAHRTAMNQ